MNNYKERILKFHQSSINIIKSNKSFIDINKTLSETFLSKYKIDTLPNNISGLLYHIKSHLESLKIITTLPIIVIKGNIYTFDFLNNELLKYKETKTIENEEFSISLFLDLEKSLLAYENLAYQEGILQIGSISQTIFNFCNENNLQVIDKFVITQKRTHELGINITKQLLIKSIFIKEI